MHISNPSQRQDDTGIDCQRKAAIIRGSGSLIDIGNDIWVHETVGHGLLQPLVSNTSHTPSQHANVSHRKVA